MRTLFIGSLALLLAAIAPAPVSAEKGDGIIEAGEDEVGELARAAQNPVANMISLPIQNNLTFEFGDSPSGMPERSS